MKFDLKIASILAIAVLSFGAMPLPTYTKADLTGRFEPETHKSFVRVANEYATQNTYLRKETYAAFVKMAKAAQKDGVTLTIVSGTRNHSRQSEIWTDKWNTFEGDTVERLEEILSYSSMPGTSRHHWGTDFDINSVEPAHFESGSGEKTYAWLTANASDYGFFQPYVAFGATRKLGYQEEKWHWSYFPISNQMLQAYKRMVKYSDISGFPAAERAQEMNVFGRFVECVPDLIEHKEGILYASAAKPSR